MLVENKDSEILLLCITNGTTDQQSVKNNSSKFNVKCKSEIQYLKLLEDSILSFSKLLFKKNKYSVSLGLVQYMEPESPQKFDNAGFRPLKLW